jgi:hypothetical protein
MEIFRCIEDIGCGTELSALLDIINYVLLVIILIIVITNKPPRPPAVLSEDNVSSLYPL